MAAFGMAIFAVAQGAVIFLTAFGFSEMAKAKHWASKIGWMTLSYLVWILITFFLWTLLGGGGGFMDGGMIPLTLSFTALCSSALFLLVWIAAPHFGERKK